MAYAGRSTMRGAGEREAQSNGGTALSAPRQRAPVGKPFRRSLEPGTAGAFGAGLALGVLVGAGAALLLAPRSGEATRAAIGRGTRDLTIRAGDAWEDLRDELRLAARRGRKRLRRRARDGGRLAGHLLELGHRRGR
jgi:hypothetical protein